MGSLLGLALAWLTAQLLVTVLHTFTRAQGVDEEALQFEFAPWLLAASVLFCSATSVISGLYPASRATKIDPAEALRST